MLTKIFPFIGWFKGYDFGSFRTDLLSGLTVAMVLIPQSMAYAQLAGLPPYYGLYAAFLPPMIASLFGSSRQLATGPVAVVSLMTAASLEPLATAGSEGYIAYALLLALMVGLFQFALGVLRLGLVVNLLSHPVVNGFTNAASIVIATSQLSKLFGVYVDKAEHHYGTIIRVVQEAIHYTHWPTLLLGTLAFAIMFILRKIAPKIPNVLVAVAITTVISWAIGFQHDASVDISAIECPRVHELVQSFNEAVNSMTPLAEERTRVAKALDEAKSAHDTVGILDAERDTSVIAFKMDQLKEEGHISRTELRHYLFSGVEQPDGSMMFFPKEETRDSVQSDGRTWRIKVGNKLLKTDNLVMMGGGKVIGVIPEGLPSFTVPKLDMKILLQLLPFAIIISLLGFMEAIAIAKAIAGKTGQRLDPNQELIGQGLANVLGSIGKSYPVSGSFSRSAVNFQAGAVSGLSAVFTSAAVVITLLFFTPLLYNLPQSVLAAVIMMAVLGLVNISGFIHAWKAQWYDGAISILSFAVTLALAPHLEKGIELGVALSLMVYIYKSMRPTVASLARHEDESLRDAIAHGLKQCKYMALVRFDGPLFFANSSYLEDQIMERRQNMKDLRHILIVSDGINDMDASGEETLSSIVDRVRAAGLDISFSGVNESVMKVMKRTFLLEKIGEDHIYPTLEHAIRSIHRQAHVDDVDEACPLMDVCRLTHA
ncbi:MAG: SulP family inorganic anion transporter [Deltaproteobacteria bacterium]|nr:SulP family inorganic anion transporter [Deltaproteobacteria bacterium]MBW2080266.1 SulP family inorganic anion transporter [Deltaproteobacteria bacterium]MBW2351251.1 SulP family inorganic anion transporter [Deltaproteobacteria bacterium]